MKFYRARLLVAAFVIGAAALFLLLTLSLLYSDNYYTSALRSQKIITTVYVSGEPLIVSSGTVSQSGAHVSGRRASTALRLAYERALALRNPIFAIPGTSPQDLEFSAERLAILASRLSSFQKNEDSAAHVRDDLYPVALLKAAAQSETARQNFLEHASADTAEAYNDSLYILRDTYQLSVRRFKDSVEAEISDTLPSYIAAGKKVNKENILSVLTQIERGAQRNARALWRRELCLKRVVIFCTSADIRVTPLEQPLTAPLSDAQLVSARNIESIYSDTGFITRPETVHFFVLAKSACTAQTPSPGVFTVSSIDTTQAIPPSSMVTYVGDIRFIKASENAATPFYRTLIQKGISYVLTTPLLQYECMEIGKDYASIFATKLYADSLLVKRDVYYESDAISEVNSLALEGNEQAIELLLAFKNGSAHLDEIARRIAWIERTNLQLASNGLPADLSASNLFYSRSGFLAFFFTHNPSFVGTIAGFPSAKIEQYQYPYQYISTVTDPSIRDKMLQDVRSFARMHLDENEF